MEIFNSWDKEQSNIPPPSGYLVTILFNYHLSSAANAKLPRFQPRSPSCVYDKLFNVSHAFVRFAKTTPKILKSGEEKR
jgi:hypothetical protein